MKTVLATSFNLGKRMSLVALIAMVNCWVLPAAAELNINNSQSVTLSKNASENQYFTQTIRLMKNPKEFELFEKLDIEQYFITDINKNVQQKYQALGVRFNFATVEGHYAGDVTGPLLAQVAIENSSDFILSLPSYIDTKPISISGLTINDYGLPVRFARLSTTSQFDDESSLLPVIAGAGFIDGVSQSYITLLYTSGKVHITGSAVEEGETLIYDILLPHQGWHWARAIKKGDNYIVVRVEKTDVDPIIFAL